MANTLLIKGSKTSTAQPSLTAGTDDGDGDASTEIAINRADGKLFYLDDANEVTEFVSTSSGNASTFTCTDNESENLECNVVFVDGATGAQGAETDGNFTYKPSTGAITATSFIGNGAQLTGLTSGATALDELSDVTYSSNNLTIDSLDEITSGSLLFDCSGEMTIDVDGGNLHIHDATKKQFEFDCDNTMFKVFDEGPSNAHSDYAYFKTITSDDGSGIKRLEIGLIDASGSAETKPSSTWMDVLVSSPNDLMLNAESEVILYERGIELAAFANTGTNQHVMAWGGTVTSNTTGVGFRYNDGEMEYRNSDHSSGVWTSLDRQSEGSKSASNITSGTLPMARLSGTLPALNASALTTINASSISSGTLAVARHSPMVGAVSATNAAGIPGVVPTPAATDAVPGAENLLSGAGTYVANKDSTYSIAAVAGSSAILRMTAAGTSSGDDDITFAEAGEIGRAHV